MTLSRFLIFNLSLLLTTLSFGQTSSKTPQRSVAETAVRQAVGLWETSWPWKNRDTSIIERLLALLFAVFVLPSMAISKLFRV